MNKVLVIGLDGAPFPLIKDWSQQGHLPNIAKLIHQGSFGVLRSTIPVHSPTAWTSFITGKNPGKHGGFDFVRRDSSGYQLRVVRADQLSGASLWRILGQNEKKVGVMNVPMTYPPEEVNGFLISGLGTPEFSTYTYPPSLTEELKAAGYRVNKKFFFTPDRQDEWLQDIFEISEMRGKTAVRLIKESNSDFFMVVFRNTDEICHFYWHHMDTTHPWHDPAAPEKYKNAILDLYKLVDKQVGQIVEAAGDNTNVIVMSDHGAGPLYRDVFLNEWLWQKGWLKLKELPARRRHWQTLVIRLGLTRKNISDLLTRLNLHRIEVMIKKALGNRILILPRDDRPEFLNAVDWSQTKAYSYGYYGQIFLNVRGREPEGIVDPGEEYASLRNEIASELLTIIDPEDGKRVTDKVYTREELYHGPNLGEAPDLLAIMRGLTYITRKGYEFAEKRGVLFREPYTEESGSHRIEGILIGSGPDIKRGVQLRDYDIQDLTPTLLYLIGCDVLDDMDGKVIKEMLSSHFTDSHPVKFTSVDFQDRQEGNFAWNEETEAELTERLKKLGYLG